MVKKTLMLLTPLLLLIGCSNENEGVTSNLPSMQKTATPENAMVMHFAPLAVVGLVHDIAIVTYAINVTNDKGVTISRSFN